MECTAFCEERELFRDIFFVHKHRIGVLWVLSKLQVTLEYFEKVLSVYRVTGWHFSSKESPFLAPKFLAAITIASKWCIRASFIVTWLQLSESPLAPLFSFAAIVGILFFTRFHKRIKILSQSPSSLVASVVLVIAVSLFKSNCFTIHVVLLHPETPFFTYCIFGTFTTKF